MAYNGFRLAEGGEILAQMLNLVKMFFRIPMLNLAPLPHFWQTDVMRRFGLLFLCNYYSCSF
jgi:hypothetical protein